MFSYGTIYLWLVIWFLDSCRSIYFLFCQRGRSCNVSLELFYVFYVCNVSGGAQVFYAFDSKLTQFQVKACQALKMGRLKLHAPNTFRGRTPIRFFFLSYRFRFIYYCLLSLLHYCTSLNQVCKWFIFRMHKSIVIFEFDHDVYSKLIKLVE